jgi:hypothetical protein
LGQDGAGEYEEFSGIAGGSGGTAEEELGTGRSGREQGRGRSSRWLLQGRCCSPEKKGLEEHGDVNLLRISVDYALEGPFFMTPAGCLGYLITH